MPFRSLDPSTAATAPVLTAGAPGTDGLTLSALRDELFKMLGNRTDVTAARLNLWINQAYADVASSIELDELRSSFGFSTVADQHLYGLPRQVAITYGAALYNPTRYSIMGGRPLEKTDLNEYRMSEEATGEPHSFFRSVNTLVLYPTPDTAYTVAVDFLVRPDALTADAHAPLLPYELHEGVLLAARYKGLAALLEFDKAPPALNDYIAFMRRKMDKAAAEDTGKVVGSMVPRRSRNLTWRKASRLTEFDNGL